MKNTKTIPRKHHFLPISYLQFFLAEQKDMLHVINLKARKHFKSKPEAVAHKRDLYILEANEETPQDEIGGFEEALSEFEGKVPPVIEKLLRSKEIPTGTDLITLINFVALTYSRVPGNMDNAVEPIEKIMKTSLQMIASDEERYKRTIMKAREAGLDVEELDYESFLEFIKRDEYTVEVNQNYRLRMLLDRIDILIPILMERSWSLVFTDDSNGGFVTSDNPVSLVSLSDLSPFWGVGFGMRNTEVTMPLSKNMILMGQFDKKPGVFYADRESVATFNARSCMYAKLLVLSANKHFIYLSKGKRVSSSSELIE